MKSSSLFAKALAVLGTLLMTVAFAPAANGASITLNPIAGPPGSTVQVSGSGFAPFASIQLEFDATPIGLVTADGGGNFIVKVKVPNPANATDHVIVAGDLAGGLTANQTFAIRTDWPMLGRDMGRTALNPLESQLGPGSLAELALRASFALPGESFAASGAVAGGTVYLANTGGVLRASDYDGNVLWSRAPGGPIFSSPAVNPSPTQCMLFMGSDDGKLYALNCADGSTSWSFTTGGPVRSSPLILSPGMPNSCRLVVGSDDGNVYALSCATGLQSWHFNTGGPVKSSPAAFVGPAVEARPTVVVVQSSDGNVYGLHPGTGAKMWSFASGGGAGSAAISRFACDGASCARAFVGSASGTVFALDVKTGTPAWSYATGSPISGSPAIAPFDVPGICAGCTAVFVGTEGGSLLAFDARNGNVLWRTELGAPVRAAPGVANGLVWVHTDALPGAQSGNISALDIAGGLELKKAPVDGDSNAGDGSSAPVLTDGNLLVGPIVLSSSALFSNWPMLRHDSWNSGYNGAETEINSVTVSSLSLEWTSNDPTLAGTPAVVDGVAYVHHSDTLSALDIYTHQTLWTATVPGGLGTPAVSKGRVFVYGIDGGVRAFPAKCSTPCKPLWVNNALDAGLIQPMGISPVVSGSTLYVEGTQHAYIDDVVAAFDVANGSLSVFRFSFEDPGDVAQFLSQPPAVRQGLITAAVYAENQNEGIGGIIVALDTAGNEVWYSRAILMRGAPPVIDSGSLVSIASDGPGTTSAFSRSCMWDCPATWQSSAMAEPRVLFGTTLNLIQSDGSQHWLAGKDAATGNDLTASSPLNCTICGGGLVGASGLMFVGSLQDSDFPADERMTVYRAGQNGVGRAYAGPFSYHATGWPVVAAGRVFVPACPSDGNGNCIGDAQLMIYSVKP